MTNLLTTTEREPISRWLDDELGHDDPLPSEELRLLAERIGGTPELWQPTFATTRTSGVRSCCTGASHSTSG